MFAAQVDITDNWRRVLFPILAFVVAWLLVKLSRVLINRLAMKIERRRLPSDGDLADTAALRSIKRHDTTVSLVGTTVRYLIFTIAVLVALTQIIGPGKSAAIASASLLIIIVGFAAQRFLTDIMAGTFMFFEGWFEVGDTITVEPLDLTGVVEEVSLRSTKLRAVTGETLRVHNSQILATRALPRGVRDVEVELFVNDEAAGRELVDDVAAIVPVGPTRFVSRPRVDDSERLDDDLIRLSAVCAVAYGRDWLANDFLPQLLRERAPDGLIVHGPVVMFVDESATRRYARSQRGTVR
ncbi:MAG TPA: mechanosensitive ion channel domain-containing protein [Gaiellales bacterium]|nr:mechanosensitive ion channel domain-containing protein [Gaiellales bacterium]